MSHWLVIYDIAHPKRLNRIAKLVSEFGVRVQKSVFEIEADNKTLARLQRRALRHIEDEDYIVYFEVCEEDWQKKEKFGVGRLIEPDSGPFRIL